MSRASSGLPVSRRVALGFPRVGRTVPVIVVSIVVAVGAAATAWVVIGPSGWLAVAGLLIVGAVALPRAPFPMLLLVQLAVAGVAVGAIGYTGRFAVLLAGAHLLFAGSLLVVRLPLRSRVQVAALRRPLLQYVSIQVPCQVVAFVVLGIGHPEGVVGVTWLGVVAAVAALVLAVCVLVPVLLRPARR